MANSFHAGAEQGAAVGTETTRAMAASGAGVAGERVRPRGPAYAIDMFSGIGGMAMAVHAAAKGLRIRCACDSDADCREVMRVRFGLKEVQLIEDVRALRAGGPGMSASLVYGGFPCQDISHAGKRLGVVRGERSSLFSEMIRVAGEAGAGYMFLENVAALEKNGLDHVLARLAEAGWSDVRVAIASASHAGARHRRRRIFILARNAALADAAAPIRYAPPPPSGAHHTPWTEESEPAPRLCEAPAAMSLWWRTRVRMLGNTCVPQQGEAALRFLLLGNTACTAKKATWCDLWRASAGAFAGAGEVQRVPPSLLPPRKPSEMCPTLVANDQWGGNNAGKREDGTYSTMTLARWVRHMPERDTWGKASAEAQPLRRGIIMRIPWACWLMGFPADWLDMELPCDRDSRGTWRDERAPEDDGNGGRR